MNKETIIIAGICVLMGILFSIALVVGIDRHEEVRCNTLLQQSKDFPEFYLTEREKEMCDYQGIEINVQVK